MGKSATRYFTIAANITLAFSTPSDDYTTDFGLEDNVKVSFDGEDIYVVDNLTRRRTKSATPGSAIDTLLAEGKIVEIT